MTATEIDRLARHAEFLADSVGVELLLDPKLRPDEAAAIACGDVRVVKARPITDDTSYAVVLHEIGHHAAELGMSGATMTKEEAAWDWACRHALEWTTGMQMVLTLCLHNYRESLWTT